MSVGSEGGGRRRGNVQDEGMFLRLTCTWGQQFWPVVEAEPWQYPKEDLKSKTTKKNGGKQGELKDSEGGCRD